MSRENKKEAVAALHRHQIILAAEELFSEKGFAQTTIDDISKASQYSRRTVYAYYDSKEDLLHHIIAKGLLILKQDIVCALHENQDFLERYFAVCSAMKKYQLECPHSSQNVIGAKTDPFASEQLSPAVSQILSLGTEINALLAEMIQRGVEEGAVRQDTVPMPAVYILWSSITSLLTLVQTKGRFLAKAFATTEDDYLMYGFKLIVNSILEVRI